MTRILTATADGEWYSARAIGELLDHGGPGTTLGVLVVRGHMVRRLVDGYRWEYRQPQ